jgi:hypothetical protein
MTAQIQPTATDVTPDGIFQIAAGFMAAKHLFVASEAGLFAQLADGPATLDDLAVRSGIPRRTLRISADAMVALGLLERTGDQYGNAPSASASLSGQGRADVAPDPALLEPHQLSNLGRTRAGDPHWSSAEPTTWWLLGGGPAHLF